MTFEEYFTANEHSIREQSQEGFFPTIDGLKLQHSHTWKIAQDEKSDIERDLRRLLWLYHGHIGLYGDDGEMQCGLCDFKRGSIEDIRKHLSDETMSKFDRWLDSKMEESGRDDTGKATITDGFGSTWSITCPSCGNDTMEIVRPGKAQCRKCG